MGLLLKEQLVIKLVYILVKWMYMANQEQVNLSIRLDALTKVFG